MKNLDDKCKNCGGDRGLHHYQTEQCPVGGVESPVDREQEWKSSMFKAEVVPFDPPQRTTNGNDEMFGRYLGHDFVPGLTKREYFAAMAMQGAMANSTLYTNKEHLAEESVEYANALIEALNKESK